MSRITITIDTTDTLDTKDFVFEVDEALNMGFKHPYEMWTVEPKTKCGRWESIDWANEYFKCSECGKIERWSPNYCATCGAKMATRTLYVRGTPNIIEEPNYRAKMEE